MSNEEMMRILLKEPSREQIENTNRLIQLQQEAAAQNLRDALTGRTEIYEWPYNEDGSVKDRNIIDVEYAEVKEEQKRLT